MCISSNGILGSAGEKEWFERVKWKRRAECMHMLSGRDKSYLEVWFFLGGGIPNLLR